MLYWKCWWYSHDLGKSHCGVLGAYELSAIKKDYEENTIAPINDDTNNQLSLSQFNVSCSSNHED
jgi:hypothetical protein